MTEPTPPLIVGGDAAPALRALDIAAAAIRALLIPETCGCSNRVHCFAHGDSEHAHPHPGMAAAYDRGALSYPGCRACECSDACGAVGHGCDECMGPPDDDDDEYTIQGQA
jgi:hypothetical protein